MRVFISPVGMQDPHGKADPVTGDLTEGSVLQIARRVQPDRVILLPTAGDGGTEKNALEARDWLASEGICADVEIRPVDLPEPQDYEAALRVYGPALNQACPRATDAFFINVSSGTPAIKAACMLIVAEGLVCAEAWYADDPTRTTRSDPVRPLDLGFFRRTALRQRTAALLQQGHFWAARDACKELGDALGPGTAKETASGWCVWLSGLQAWDERQYDEARRQIIEARRWEPLTVCEPCAGLLRQCLQSLDARSAPGWTAWDLYHMAGRLALQGRHSVALEWAWVAVQTSVRKRLQGLGSGCGNLVQRLEDIDAPGVATFFSRSFDSRPARDALDRLWRLRCHCIHEGKSVQPQQAEEMLRLTNAWLTDVVGSDYATSPIAHDSLAKLAYAFGDAFTAAI